MDTLDGTEWDVVIVGTGLAESLLALSLSRTRQRILHLDPNDYYGGDEAAFSLSEAAAWTERHRSGSGTIFRHASVQTREGEGEQVKLASSRAYSIALAPHLIYSRSNLVSTVVSTRIHNQLEFQAVGSWFVLDQVNDTASLTKVPGGREDVFADTTLDLKSKRSLMKFLRFVADYEEKREVWEGEKDTPFPTFLQSKFGLPQASLSPILALTMSLKAPTKTSTELALSRIARHARSIGTFGPGFGAVLPKWGGLAEIAQVACRACAVGGGVYVLGKGVKSLREGDQLATLTLEGDDTVTTRWLASSNLSQLNGGSGEQHDSDVTNTSNSVSIVASSLAELFPPTSEGGVTPAGAVVVVPGATDNEPPVHIFAHTSEAGECPSGQCILYASVALPSEKGFSHLQKVVASLLERVHEDLPPPVIWRMQYEQRHPVVQRQQEDNGVIKLASISSSLALEDEVLDDVKAAWRKTTGGEEATFMQFDAREGIGDEDE